MSNPGEGPQLWIERDTADSAPMCEASGPVGPVGSAELGHRDARRTLARARALAADGRYGRAVLHLRTVARIVPRVADRMALEEAGYRMQAGPDERACEAYERATQSEHRTVATRATVGLARCLLTIGERRGEEIFEDLRRRYPELPQEQELSFLLGRSHELRGEPEEAGRIYRALDLRHPGSSYARAARERIAGLLAAGTRIRELTAVQQVERAERLVRGGPMPEARREVARLREAELPRELSQRVARAAARIARVEGRWEDAHRLLREAQGLPGLEEDERVRMTARMRDLAQASGSRDQDEVLRRIRSLTRGRALRTQPTARLFAILRMAARSGLRDVADDVVEALGRRNRLPPGLAFDAAVLAAGTAADEGVAELFGAATRHPTYGVGARYHRARALERLGRIDEARREFAEVIREDSTRLPYYALWARQRLRATSHVDTRTPEPVAALLRPLECGLGPFSALTEEMRGKSGSSQRARDRSCVPAATPANPFLEPESEPEPTAAEPPDPLAEADEAASELELRATERAPDHQLEPEEIEALLVGVTQEHGEFFPWLQRAVDLVRIGEMQAAGDEVHETYVAWREASGRGGLRAGLEGVMRGGRPARHRVSMATWRGRRRLSREARRSLARVSAALGDHGLAIRFGGSFDVSGPRPRAYAPIVEAAARRHGVEPELLFAVMRVESVYNPRIISYAGAVGLMQIMPRTGRLIAHASGHEDFTVDELLNPEVNIEFAAWYLASLIERFDGRLPLAIASYNGGPHNVRRWMRDHGEDMPLDAFLEIIPFGQTHRYVRRVLTHYEAYRAQRGLRPAGLDTRLPDLAPDRVAF